MKIAVVVYHFPVTSETFVINHVISLLEAGNDVTVFSLHPHRAAPVVHPQFAQHNLERLTVYGSALPGTARERVSGFVRLLLKNAFRDRTLRPLRALNVFRFGKKALGLKMFYQCQSFLEQNEFDLIHCHFGNVGNDVQRLQRAGLVSGKLVVSFHGCEFLQDEIIRQNDSYKGVFGHCHCIVANSTFTFNRLVAMGCPPQKLVTLPVTASDALFAKKTAKAQSGTKPFNIVTIARLVEKKGVEFGIKAAALLKQTHRVNFVYHILGDGPLLPALQKLINENNLEDSVVLHGSKPQNEVAHFLTEADVFLLPSIVDSRGDTETQGLVLIEAQLMGLPVVSTNVGGIPDSVSHGRSGILVDEKDPAQLASALHRLYRDEALRKQFGENGKSFVRSKFDSKLITKRMHSTYEKLLSEVD